MEKTAKGPIRSVRFRLSRIQQSTAAWLGWMAYSTAKKVRRLAAIKAKRDSDCVAVMCLGFLQYASMQATGLQAAGLKVTLYYVDRRSDFSVSEEDRSWLLERAQTAGVKVVRVPPRRIRSLVKDTLWLHRDIRRRRIAKAVIQSHTDPRYATLGLRLPVALMVHDPKPHSGDTLSTFPLPLRIIARSAEVTSACLIIHSCSLSSQIRPLLQMLPIGVVPHGAEMAPAPAEIPQARRVLIFGRLFEYKGVDTALEAFQVLPGEMDDVELIIAGRGPLADMARAQPNVTLREEYVTEADVHALMADVRLVLLPYKDATQSGVGLQAVARGVPCIVTSTGGLPELVRESSMSLIVPPNDPARLAKAIVTHIDHDAGLRRSIYDHAATNFAWPVVGQRLRSELQRLGIDQDEDLRDSPGKCG